MVFQEAKHPEKLFVFVTNQILDAIKKEAFLPGELLPSERELSESFGVSRPVIREAISSLQIIGAVKTERGKGTFVLDNNSTNSKQNLWLLENEESPLQVLEARSIIEPGSAKLAAERRNLDDITRMKVLIEKMDKSINDLKVYSELDLQFHMEVAIASKNTVIQKFVESVINYGKQDLGRLIREKTHHRGSKLAHEYANQHVLLFEAIVAGDPYKASEAMRLHLTSAYNNWFETQEN